MAKQAPAERLFTLTCCLMASPRLGISKQDIYRAVSGYQEATGDEARDRMFERDKQALRDAGVRLEVSEVDGYDETEQSRYKISSSTFDWPKDLTLTPKKLQLLELAAKAWNNQLLEGSAQQGLMRLKSLGLVAQETDLRPFSPKLLTRHSAFGPLANAISENLQVAFRYQKPEGDPTDRVVTPLKLRQLQGQWVLLALHDSIIKNFLLRRIVSEVELTDLPGASVAPDALQLAEHELSDFVSGNVATLEVIPDTEAALVFHPSSDGLVDTSFMDEALFAEDLLEFGGQIKVIAPESLKRRVRSGLKAVIKAHA